MMNSTAGLRGRLEKKEQAITSDNEKKMEEICLFIKDNINEDLNRDMLASAAEMIPDTFSRIFNKYTGMNLPDYINRQRVEAAIKLLETTDKSVTRISMETGFESLRTFNRVFKKITGESPGDYRARLKNSL
jgi:transcriptional regulator GlxA family with amidase domain